LRYTSPDTAAFFSSSPPTSLPFAAASHLTLSSTLPTDLNADIDTVTCAQCDQDFTGTYRNGNLARHVRQKHAAGNRSAYECTAQGCSRVFQRPDARLKHARKRHPELRLPPVQRRHGTEHYPATPYVQEGVHVAHDLDYNVGQWLQPDDLQDDNHAHKAEDKGNSPVGIEHLSYAAQYVLTILKARLHPTDYSRSCDSFFTRWESIVQQLFESQQVNLLNNIGAKLTCSRSNAYPIYAKVLEDIRAVVHANNVIAYTACSGSNGPTSRASHGQWAAPRGNGNLGLGHGSPRISKRKQSITGGAGKNVLVALGENSNQERRRDVDCPVYKYHLMHNTTPPCRGCRVGVMSQVRSHLNPSRTGTHRGFPEFIEQCSRCKQDFVEQQQYNDHTTANTCVFQSQARGDIVIPWARQYLALYPTARRIPLPWPDERGWLPDRVLTQCMALNTDSTVISPFLGQRQGRNDAPPQMPSEIVNSTEGPEYTGAMDHVLHDLVNPTYIQASRAATPVLNRGRLPGANLGSPFNGTTGTNSQYWESILYSFQSHQRIIRQAATHLTREQLHYMATESEQMFNISRGMYQQHQLQPTQIQTQPAVTYAGSSTQDSNAAYRTSVQHQRLQTSIYNQFTPPNPEKVDEVATPSTTTIPSNGSYGVRSSQRHESTLATPSSDYGPYDPRLLSPYSPSDRRRTSLPPDVVHNGPRLRRAFPSRRSLPDNPEGNIDPTLLQSPMNDNDADHDDLMRQYSSRWS
jgi:hypothetical protein